MSERKRGAFDRAMLPGLVSAVAALHAGPRPRYVLVDYPDRAITYLLALATAYRMAPQYSQQDWASARLLSVLRQECERYQVSADELLDATTELAPCSELDETLRSELDE